MADNFDTQAVTSVGAKFASDEVVNNGEITQVPYAKIMLGGDSVNDGPVSSINPMPVNIEEINGGSIATGNGATSATTLRVTMASDSTQSGQIVDNNPFTDGTTRINMNGYVYDEVAGTALTENDGAAARIDDKRAQIMVVEDATTRGRRQVVDSTGAASVTANSVVSTNNSSTATLGISGVFTGTSDEVTNYSTIMVSVFANQASATNGLSLQQSQDGTNWDFSDTFTIPASTGKTYSFQPIARFFRVVYTNGGSAQGTFRLQTVYHRVMTKPSSQRPADAMTNEDDLIQGLSYSMGYNGTTWDRLRSDTTNGLDVDVTRIIPGTGATNLGKAIDTAVGATDTGVAALVVRDDVLGTLTPADNDFTVLRVDNQGKLWTHGQIAHDSAIQGSPFRIGGRARTSDYTAVASDDQADAITDTVGKQIVLPYSIPENFVQGVTAAITDTSTTSVIASAGASRRNYITSLTVTNSHATVGTVVEIRDGASTVMHRGYAAPLGGGYSVTFPVPLKGSAATAVNAVCITTGSNTYVSANGYTAP